MTKKFKAGDIVTLDKTCEMNTFGWTSYQSNASFDVDYKVLSVSDTVLNLEGVKNACLARRFKLVASPKAAPTKPPLVSLKLPAGVLDKLVEQYLKDNYQIDQSIKSMFVYGTGIVRVTLA